MKPFETQYDAHKKLVHALKRDRKILTFFLIAGTLILLGDLVYIGYLIVTIYSNVPQ